MKARHACLLLIASILPANGCSIFIARSGKDLSAFNTRQQVQEEFGKPVAAGTAEGQPYEEYRTRQKIAEPMRAAGLGMGIPMTYGVGELFCFPYELYLLGRRTAFGQEVRFVYNDAGNVDKVFLEGEWLSSFPGVGPVGPDYLTASR